MEMDVKILEDVIRGAQLRAICGKSLNDALMQGPDVYYEAILHHKPPEELGRWDILIMSFLCCTLINEINMQLLKEMHEHVLTIPGEDAHEHIANIRQMALSLVNNGEAWVEKNADAVRASGVTAEDASNFSRMREEAIKRVKLTDELMIPMMKQLYRYLKEYDLLDFVLPTYKDAIQTQLLFYDQYRGMLLDDRIMKPSADVPKWENSDEGMHGAEWVWKEKLKLGTPNPNDPVDVVGMMVCCNNIVTGMILEMVEDVTAMIIAEDDRLTQKLIDQFRDVIDECEKFQKICKQYNLEPSSREQWPLLKAVMTDQSRNVIPKFRDIHDTIEELHLGDCFPPNPYVVDRCDDFIRYYARLITFC